MDDPAKRKRFEATVLVHLDAAFNLARWMLRAEADAQDAVQEAALRALRFFASMQGPRAKAWFMAIVRNACRDRLKKMLLAREDAFDEEQHVPGSPSRAVPDAPHAAAERNSDARWLHECIAALPPD